MSDVVRDHPAEPSDDGASDERGRDHDHGSDPPREDVPEGHGFGRDMREMYSDRLRLVLIQSREVRLDLLVETASCSRCGGWCRAGD